MIMKFCFHTTKEMMSMLLVVAVDITVIVRVHQNSLEKLDDLYSLRLVAHTQWSLWDLVILWAILIDVQFDGSTANGILLRKRTKIFLVN